LTISYTTLEPVVVLAATALGLLADEREVVGVVNCSPRVVDRWIRSGRL
jgi:hypothetical protein